MLNQKLMGAGAAEKTYIEDVFSTYLYTGTGAAQTINNGIDLAGKGGMVWLKARGTASSHGLFDTARGVGTYLDTSSTAASGSYVGVSAFNSNGFSLGTSFNPSGGSYASWTFRKAPKFFDVVTYTGDGVAGRTISHSLGQAPGMIIVKCTNTTGNWAVYHTSMGNGNAVFLNSTAASGVSNLWYNTTPTASSFYLGSNATVNGSGNTYVAYLFAHDTTTDGLIQCGSFTTDASGKFDVNLGWEPQYVLVKQITSAGDDWLVADNMRGFGNTSMTVLRPNTTTADNTYSGEGYLTPYATGFKCTNNLIFTASKTYIYMAIRRGPMRTPTDGTKVFGVNSYTATTPAIQSSFTVDFFLNKDKSTGSNWVAANRLTGNKYLIPNSTDVENNIAENVFGYQTGCRGTGAANYPTYLGWMFQRAPGFFDVVCYTGTGVVTHNLGVKPELVIYKPRNFVFDWPVDLTNHFGYLNKNNALTSGSVLASRVTATTWQPYNTISGVNMVAYLFASCPGVSKVGSYTGNGTSQTIDCGFTNGARFVLIKRTDSTGDWYVWDTARGIVAANDPHLSLNTTAAEVTTDDTIDPNSTGFVVNQVADTNVNVSGGSYIYLAVA